MSPFADLAHAVLSACETHGLMLATAESCTGGMIASALTDIPGSSSVVDRGFVTYSNDSKTEMLGVPAETLLAHGAVSRETAIAMAEGALARSNASITVAVTGVAGPGGGTAQKPVGLVWFAVASSGSPTLAEHRLFDERGRDHIRQETVRTALELMLASLNRR
jgi:nicotinamide-nucleotide amidase